jgi:predicted transposase YbfD/YdcC
LGQEKTANKSNEITAIPLLLDVLDLKDALVSIDAIGCQIEIASKIIDKAGDYLLAVKQNQKTLYEDIQSAFLVHENNENTTFVTEEINGSKFEKRTCKIMTDITHITKAEDWKNLQTIVKIESEIYHKSKNKTTTEERYYISSQTNSPETFLKYTRNHWLIENKLHWSLDVILKEDQSRKRNNNVTENFSIVLKLVLKLLQEKQLKNKKISIKRMRKMAAWNLDYLVEMLNF